MKVTNINHIDVATALINNKYTMNIDSLNAHDSN